MDNTRSPVKGQALAVLLGAVGGGLLVALATKAIPKMVPELMSGMMLKMMEHMKQGGLKPPEM